MKAGLAGQCETSLTCTGKGTYKKCCKSCGEFNGETFEVGPNGHRYAEYVTPATSAENGEKVTKCSVCGSVKGTEAIAALAEVKLSAKTYTYNGEVKSPEVIA